MRNLFANISKKSFMFVESVSMSVANIMKNRLRSFLTILGIMIGVTAVIALVTTVSGVSNSISDSFTSMGAGSMTVSITGTDLKSGLDSEDMEEITQLDHVEGVTPSVSLSARVSRNGVNETGVSVSGKNDYYFENDESVIERGRAINPLDIEDQNRVCLISEEMMESFFFGVVPVGETLYIEGRSFTVIGVLSDSEDSSISSMLSGSNDIMIPYTTALKMNNVSTVSMLTVYIDSAESSAIVESELEEMLDALFNYEDDTYTITTMEGIEDTMSSMLSMMSALLGGIASIALVVGGIGIMNMMLTSVTERTVEIGLKKAIGAEPGQIQLQFLIESFLLSMIGGIAGVILGIVLSAVLCSALGITFSLNYGAIILG